MNGGIIGKLVSGWSGVFSPSEMANLPGYQPPPRIHKKMLLHVLPVWQYQDALSRSCYIDYSCYGLHMGVGSYPPVFGSGGLVFDNSPGGDTKWDRVNYENLSAYGSLYGLMVAFKPTTTITTATAGQRLMTFGQTGDYPAALALGNFTSSLTNEIVTVGNKNGARSGYCQESASLSNTAYHIVVARWDGSKYCLLLDGEDLDITVYGTPELITLEQTIIGCSNLGTNYSSGYVGNVAAMSLFISSIDAQESLEVHNWTKHHLEQLGLTVA